jgi:excisionase family DNA binding protein
MNAPLERDGLLTAVLDAREAAAYLAVKLGTLYTLVRAGELPHTRVGNNLRFRLVDLDAYLEARTSTEWKRVDGRGRPRKKRAA